MQMTEQVCEVQAVSLKPDRFLYLKKKMVGRFFLELKTVIGECLFMHHSILKIFKQYLLPVIRILACSFKILTEAWNG